MASIAANPVQFGVNGTGMARGLTCLRPFCQPSGEQLSDKAAEDFVARPKSLSGRILDIACGTGNTAIPAERAGGLVTGVDLIPNLLQQARKRAAEEQLDSSTFDIGCGRHIC
jgi:SAM-dependent methyltransferase